MLGPELVDTKTIMRIVAHKPMFIPPGARFPIGMAFAPSSEDKLDADRRAMPVLVSVWDTDSTTPEQAKSFRTTPTQTTAYGLRVSDIVLFGAVEGKRRIHVFADPLSDARPGADGHCGIAGLDKRPGEDRRIYKTILDDVAQRCFLMPGEVPPASDSACL
jgi:hypothetical protein